MKVTMEQWLNDNEGEKPKNLEKNICPLEMPLSRCRMWSSVIRGRRKTTGPWHGLIETKNILHVPASQRTQFVFVRKSFTISCKKSLCGQNTEYFNFNSVIQKTTT
jgi:hypothetical protein